MIGDTSALVVWNFLDWLPRRSVTPPRLSEGGGESASSARLLDGSDPDASYYPKASFSCLVGTS